MTKKFSGKTILIAENDETNFFYYKEAFRKTDAEILWAKNGKEAVEVCSKNPKVNLVFMDIQMPVLNGYEATKKIKENCDIPVVVLTAYAMKSVKKKSKMSKCDEFLTKPMRSADLIAVAEKYL